MHYLLFVFVFIWFAFIAPLKVTLAVCLSLFAVTWVIKATATAVIGPSTYKEAFKAIAFAFIFMALAVLAVSSFSRSTGQGLPLYPLLAGFLVSYILGFKIGLGGDFKASAIVAAVSTAVSGVLLVILRPLLA